MGGYSYPDSFFAQSNWGYDVIWLFVAAYFLLLLFTSALSIAFYVLESLGMHNIAKRRGIRNSWLAWIPFANLWVLGSISDQYQYLVKGKLKNRRKALLVLGIGIAVLYCIWLIGLIVSAFTGGVLSLLAGTLGGALLMAALVIFLRVLEYIALYDLYRSCQPENGVLYLVLSIFIPAVQSVFVFACRKKDLGMPPRKQPVPEQIVEPVEEPVVEEVLEDGYASDEEFEE